MSARPPYTDSRWRPDQGGLPEKGWTSPTAGAIGAGYVPQPYTPATITPPEPAAEPAPEPHPADSRLADAENALMAARRNVVNALDWIERGLRDVRKARGQS